LLLPLSLLLIRLATLLCVLTALKDTRFDLVLSCFAASNGPCKAVPRAVDLGSALILVDRRDLGLITQSIGKLGRADRGEEVGVVRIELVVVRSTGRAVERMNEYDQTEESAGESRLSSRKIERIAAFSWCKFSKFRQSRVQWKCRLSSRKTESSTWIVGANSVRSDRVDRSGKSSAVSQDRVECSE
jgi:hypothetical protein